MSVKRSVLAIAALGVLLVVLTATGSSTADSDLDGQVAALKERIATLETELAAIKKNVRSHHPDPAMERAALTAYQEINTLVQAGQMVAAKPKLDAFMAEYANTRPGQRARSLQTELSVVGKPAPQDWKLNTWFQGEGDIDLANGGPTVLVFWETWCPHCQREVPKMQELLTKYGADGLQVLGLSKLSRGTSAASIQQFIDKHGVAFPLAKEDGTLSNHFGVSGIPAVAVVKDQEVVWRGHPAGLSESLITSWLP